MKGKLAAAVRIGLGLGIAALSLALALRNVDLQEVVRALAAADPRWVGLALLSVAANTLAKGFRWRVLLGPPGQRVPFGKLMTSLLAGQMLNTLYPARVGDLSRAHVVGLLGPGRVYTLGTVLLEKLLDMLAYILLFLLLILLMPLPEWVNNSIVTLTLVVVSASAGVLVAARRPAWLAAWMRRLAVLLPERVRARVAGRFHSALSSLDVLQSPAALRSLGAWTMVVWGTAVLNNHLALLAMGIRLPWTASLLLLMVLMAGISLPSAPGRIGVFEYSCILALSIFGIRQAQALSYGILLHAVVLLPTTLLGLLAFLRLGVKYRPQTALETVEGTSADTPV